MKSTPELREGDESISAPTSCRQISAPACATSEYALPVKLPMNRAPFTTAGDDSMTSPVSNLHRGPNSRAIRILFYPR